MIRIAHLSDLHLGTNRIAVIRDKVTRQNQREADFAAAAHAVADYLIEQRPDIVVIAGDALDKFHVGTAAIDGAISFFERLHQADLPVVVIGGNHDQPHSTASKISLNLLERHGVLLFLEQGTLDLAGARLHLVPYRALARARGDIHQCQPFAFAEEMPNVLVAHGYAPGDGVNYPPEPLEIPSSWLLDRRFDLVCLGHVHIQAEIHPHVFYGGIIERTNFGEVDVEPGFYMHTLADDGALSSERVTVASLGVPGVPRPMRRYSVQAADKSLVEVRREVEQLLASDEIAGAMVLLTLLDVPADFPRAQLEAEWANLFYETGGMHLETDFQTPRARALLEVRFAELPGNLADAFEQWMRQQEIDDPQERERSIEIGLELLTLAREQLAVREN